MSQQPHTSSSSESLHGNKLFSLISEVGTEPEAAEERQQERRRRLQAAGVMLSSGCEESPRGEPDICGPPAPYPRGVSPSSGSLHWGA